MAEVVGLAASIIQIAGAGAKLSVTLYNFTSSAARADQDIRDIADDVELTSNALESVGKVFESEDTKSIISKKAVQDAHKIIKKCQGVFDELSEMVEKRRKTGKDGKKTLSMMGKLAWPMKEQRVELHRKRLESLKNSLVLLLHVLQLAQGQSRGKIEKSVIEEERDKIRELHQRQQDSIKSLQALESRFCGVAIDDEETLQRSSKAFRVPTLELMTNAQTMKLPPLEKDIESRTNTVTIDISATDDSDTSDSDATMTDEDDEHISIEELSKAAKHVRKLLRRIIVLQKSLENDQKPHQKRRVRKIYQRFCRKFESGINVTQATGPSRHGSPATRSSNQYIDALDLGDMGGGALENFDFDSFLHVGSESTPFPVVPQQQQPMSPLPPRQHLNEPRPEEFQFDFNHTVPNMNSEAVSSCDARFQIPGFAVPGAYFSPVTSPALNAQSHQYAHQQSQNTTSGSSTRHSPINVDMDMLGEPVMVPHEQGRRSLRSKASENGNRKKRGRNDSEETKPEIKRQRISSRSPSNSPVIESEDDSTRASAPKQKPRRAAAKSQREKEPNRRNAPRANANGRIRQLPIVKPNRRKAKQGSRFEEFDGGGLPEDGSLMTRSIRSTQKRKRSRSIVSDAVRQRKPHAQETPSIPDDMRTPVVRHPSDDEQEQEADRPRDNKIRCIRSTLGVGLEGTYSTLLQKEKKRKQIFELEEPFDTGDRDVVDVLLEQWTVPEH
ncbi:unnamed protein product [Alternaria alternata]|uniref:Fungal N-terminal domain-containing protein n=1 Tax=Alternaria tenuissima TaxID=119927 RepID=A0A4Q4MFH1_9PLEO|nr:hypothetical protein AA0114_g6420 [Alternaria tenuissima]